MFCRCRHLPSLMTAHWLGYTCVRWELMGVRTMLCGVNPVLLVMSPVPDATCAQSLCPLVLPSAFCPTGTGPEGQQLQRVEHVLYRGECTRVGPRVRLRLTSPPLPVLHRCWGAGRGQVHRLQRGPRHPPVGWVRGRSPLGPFLLSPTSTLGPLLGAGSGLLGTWSGGRRHALAWRVWILRAEEMWLSPLL